MTAEIVSVGTELLLGQIVDTHAPTMGRVLAECGIGCRRRTTVGDNLDRLTEVFRESLSRADVVIAIGGLGPTGDDLTREAIAAALDEELVKEPEVEAALRAWFAERNYPFAESNAKQALRPESAQLIDNPNGTAPGLVARKNGKTVIALPGPKGEFDPMAHGAVRKILASLGGGTIHSRTLRIVGMGESAVDERLRDLMDRESPTLAPYAHVGEVHLRLTARGATVEEAAAALEPLEAEIRERLGSVVYGVDGETLEEAVVKRLTERGETIGTAESMTAGALAARIAAVPGASAVFRGGVVTYDYRLKESLLGVENAEDPVSPEVARQMADLTREKLGVDRAIAVTGNAGPTSDKGGKPVGLVYIAWSGPEGTEVEELRLRGVREDILKRTVVVAMQRLRDKLAG